MRDPDLTPDTLEEDLSAWIDGELTPERESELRERLASDPVLAARLAELEAVSEQLRALPVPQPSPALRDTIRTSLDDERARRPGWVAPLATGVALAASLVLYFAVAPGGGGSEELLEAATDEEIGIAIEYDVLADLELIEDLDVLEWMAEKS